MRTLVLAATFIKLLACRLLEARIPFGINQVCPPEDDELTELSYSPADKDRVEPIILALQEQMRGDMLPLTILEAFFEMRRGTPGEKYIPVGVGWEKKAEGWNIYLENRECGRAEGEITAEEAADAGKLRMFVLRLYGDLLQRLSHVQVERLMENRDG